MIFSKKHYLFEFVISMLFFVLSLLDPSMVFGRAVGFIGVMILFILANIAGCLAWLILEFFFSKLKQNLLIRISLAVFLTGFMQWSTVLFAYQTTALGQFFYEKKITYHCLTRPDFDLCARSVTFDAAAALMVDVQTKQKVFNFLHQGYKNPFLKN